MVKANVLNTPLLPVTILMAASPVAKEIGTGIFETNKSFDKIDQPRG
jgi:hypothetical protein